MIPSYSFRVNRDLRNDLDHEGTPTDSWPLLLIEAYFCLKFWIASVHEQPGSR